MGKDLIREWVGRDERCKVITIVAVLEGEAGVQRYVPRSLSECYIVALWSGWAGDFRRQRFERLDVRLDPATSIELQFNVELIPPPE